MTLWGLVFLFSGLSFLCGVATLAALRTGMYDLANMPFDALKFFGMGAITFAILATLI